MTKIKLWEAGRGSICIGAPPSHNEEVLSFLKEHAFVAFVIDHIEEPEESEVNGPYRVIRFSPKKKAYLSLCAKERSFKEQICSRILPDGPTPE